MLEKQMNKRKTTSQSIILLLIAFEAVTISVGVGNMPNTASHHNELFNLIDQALYSAKGNGRNQTVKADHTQ
jgi:GGDEF domain-containing protein